MRKYFTYYKNILILAFPILLTQVGQVMVQFVDNAMIGHVGTTELAATSFAGSLFSMVLFFSMGLVYAITPYLGKIIGEGKEDEIKSTVKNSIILYVLITPILFVLAYSLVYVLPILGQTDEVLELALPYYKIMCYSFIPFMLFMIIKQIAEGFENTILAMYSTLLSNVINIILNYIFIFGKLGFPAMGLQGAAYATLIARLFLPFALFFFLKKQTYIYRYITQLSNIKLSIKKMLTLIKLGLPISIQILVEVSLFSIAAIMMGWFSDQALAAHQVAISFGALTFMFANSFSMATTIRISIQKGKNDQHKMKMISRAAFHLVLTIMAIFGISFIFFSKYLPVIFTNDIKVIEQASVFLIFVAMFQLFDGLQVVCLGILRGISDVKVPMYLALVSYLMFGIGSAYLLAFKFNVGPNGIWYGLIIGLSTASVLLLLRVRYMWNR